MKTQISRISFQHDKRYSGVYQQQGRMITDSDWNELNDIIRARMADALKDIIGSGAREFRMGNNGAIIPGEIYVDGIRAEILDSKYAEQRDFPNAPAVGANPIYYVDLWERTVTSLQDPSLIDPGLNVDTCSRKQVLAQVKWCANVADIMDAKNPAKGNAVLKVEWNATTAESDPCGAEAAKISASSETGSYLLRLEVHHVEGDADAPSKVILKWSNENGAEQFEVLTDANGNPQPLPSEFQADGYLYEFFCETSEKHLGVHLAPNFRPKRDGLENTRRRSYAATLAKSEVDDVRASFGLTSVEPLFIRRWDGYCVLTRAGGWSAAGWSGDGGSITIPTTADDLTISTRLIKCTLSLGAAGPLTSFVAGDHWLVVVRARAAELDRIKLLSAEPIGITHHYLKLTTEAAASDAEKRRFSFPPLTDIWANKVRYSPSDATIEAAWRDLLALPAASRNWPLDTQSAIDAIVRNIEEQDYVLVCEPPNTSTVLSLTATPKTADGVVKLSDALKSLMCKLDLSTLPYITGGPENAKTKIEALLGTKLDKSGGTITGALTIGAQALGSSLKINSTNLPEHGSIELFTNTAQVEWNGGVDKEFSLKSNADKTAFFGGNWGFGAWPEAPLDVFGKVRFCKDEAGSGTGERVIGFARDTGDEANAGKIVYRATWANDALSILGAGTQDHRKVKIWDVLEIPGSIHIGSAFSKRAVSGRVEVAGAGAEFSFVRRDIGSWPASPKPGDRYVWYTDTKGVAHLWTEGNSNLVDVDRDGNITIKGTLTAKDFIGIKIDHITGLNDKITGLNNRFVNIEGRLPIIPDRSDSRLKKNISPIDSALDMVSKLRGVSFQWREPKPERGRSDGTVLGVIAQEVEAVLPGLVTQDDEGMRRVSYEGLTALCLQALKEQQVLIERLSSRVSELEARLDR